jgi:putative nucleotide binding protein
MERDKRPSVGKEREKKQFRRRDRSYTSINLSDPVIYVLDFLPQGGSIRSSRHDPLHSTVYALGVTTLSILEIHFKEGTISTGAPEKLSLQKHKSNITRIRRISYEILTSEAKSELPAILDELVDNEEKRFVEFFNNAYPITNRLHQLRLLPGIGETRMWDILNARKKSPFESYQDLKDRAKISNPQRLISTRILQELECDEKHYLFVRKKRERTDDHSSSRRSF